MSFIVEKIDGDDRFFVKQIETGWLFPVESEIQASELCKKFNELDIVERPLDLHIDFTEYEVLNDKMNNIARLLVKTETKYQKEADELLAKAKDHKAETGEDIIKNKYGGNNDKTRKKYVDETLQSLADEIQEIKFQRDETARSISFIKRLIDMKIQLLRIGVRD